MIPIRTEEKSINKNTLGIHNGDAHDKSVREVVLHLPANFCMLG